MNTDPSKSERDNRADQKNPNNDTFYKDRGLGGKPEESDKNNDDDDVFKDIDYSEDCDEGYLSDFD
jgi:hypothetical protein